MSRDDDAGIRIEGKLDRKVRVYQMNGRDSVGIAAEYDDDDDLLKRHRVRLDRHEAVLVHKRGQPARYVPVREYLEELKARKT